MRNIKLTNGAVSVICSETDVSKMEEYLGLGFVPEKDADGNVVTMDIKTTISSSVGAVQEILDSLNKDISL